MEFMYLALSRLRICVDVSLMESMYLVFTRRPGESYRRRFRSVLSCSSDVFEPKLTSLRLWILYRHTKLDSVPDCHLLKAKVPKASELPPGIQCSLSA